MECDEGARRLSPPRHLLLQDSGTPRVPPESWGIVGTRPEGLGQAPVCVRAHLRARHVRLPIIYKR